MYSQHFGLTQDPFSIAPDPRYLFMSARHREALAHLLFGVSGPHRAAGGSGGGFVLLTGDIGTGKTTICRCFLEQIPSGCHVAYIFNPKLTVNELLESICQEFHVTVPLRAQGLPTAKVYIDALNTFLLESHAAGHSSVLIIDEAQNLQADVLEQLRLLTNLETNARKLLQIVLIGQPELRTMLQRPDLEQLAQRVIARFHLDALTADESEQYIAHRLAVAGHTGPLPFDRSALQRIHQLARGVPRRINLLCGRALLGAWAHGQHRVTRAVVVQAAAEVFGPEHATASTAGSRARIYLLGATCVLLGAAAAGLASANWPQKKRMQTVPIAQPAQPVSSAASGTQASRTSASAPTQPASSTVAAVASAPAITSALPIESLDALLPQLPHDIAVAWSTLAPIWQLPADLAEPCATAPSQPLQCYRTTKLTMPLLRQLGRPGILTLQTDAGTAQYAVLIGLNDQTATLKIGTQSHTVSLIALGRLWHGDFATFWRAPAGYNPAVRGGSAGPAIQELARQLGQLDGVPAQAAASAPQRLDTELRARVQDFQRAHGLQPDGLPGPMTYMQIESALGTQEPRLLGYPR